MPKFRKPQGALEWNQKQIEKVLKQHARIWAYPKIDGVRATIGVDQGNRVYIFSRSGKDFPALRQWIGQLQEHQNTYHMLAMGYEIDVELQVLKGFNGEPHKCEDTSGILQRLEQLDSGLLLVNVFDLIDPEHKEYPLCWRYASLLRYECHNIETAIRDIGSQVITLEPVVLFDIEEVDRFYCRQRDFGYEGAIYRDLSCPVRAGKVLGMWKRKPEETQEAIITNLYEAVDEQGNPKGMIGSFGVKYEDGTVGRVGAGAMVHAARVTFWEQPDRIIGRMIEVKMMEEFETGGKRHPNFKMFRDSEDNKGVKV